MIPSGTHNATIVEHARSVAGTGTKQLAVLFDIAGQGTITGYLYFSDAALPLAEQQLRAMGWDPTERGWPIEELNGTGMLSGRECPVRVESEAGRDGVNRARVRWIGDSAGGLAIKEAMDGGQATTFGASLRSRLQALGKITPQASPAGAPSLPPQSAAPPQGGSEEAPPF